MKNKLCSTHCISLELLVWCMFPSILQFKLFEEEYQFLLCSPECFSYLTIFIFVVAPYQEWL